MRVNGVQNKYEIFQDFYFETNGVKLSYNEAVRLFYQMDAATENSFLQYYADEVGYELVEKKDADGNTLTDDDGNVQYISPFVSANGYNLDKEFNAVIVEGKKSTQDKKRVYEMDGDKRKKDADGKYIVAKDSDGNPQRVGRTLWDKSDIARANRPFIEIQYMLEAYMKENNLIMDPQWSQFSAEEIIQMSENGTAVPDDVLKIANQIMQSEIQTEIEDENAEGVEGEEPTEEKKTFLELIPEAKKDIKKCEETNEKIDEKVDDLVNNTKKNNNDLQDKMKEQKNALQTYEGYVREWQHLKDKMDNGEVLTDSETKRFGELSDYLGAQKDKSDNMSLNKSQIASNLSEINILAMLGEDLAQETIEVGQELQDYTSKKNFKSTVKEVGRKAGFGMFGILAYLITMMGKAVGKQAIEIGEATGEYTSEAVDSVAGIAETLDITNRISTVDENGEVVDPEENNDEEDTQKIEKEEDKKDEFFYVTDEEVKKYIDEANGINAELIEQIKVAMAQIKQANSDVRYAKEADKIVTEIVNAYWAEEQKRQEEIAQKEEENKEAQEKIEELQGGDEAKESKKLAEEYGINVENDKANQETQQEIAEQQEIINQNNVDIEDINLESEQAKADVVSQTAEQKAVLDERIPKEYDALKLNAEYQEKDLPEHNERMDFINRAGINLMIIGAGNITLGGVEMAIGINLMSCPWTFHTGMYIYTLGTATLLKGQISVAIGNEACVASKDESKIEDAEEATDIAGENINGAVKDLTSVNTKIEEVTGEYSNYGEENIEGLEPVEETQEESGDEAAAEGENTVDGEAAATDEVAGDAVEGDAVEETAQASSTEASNETSTEESSTNETSSSDDTTSSDDASSSTGTTVGSSSGNKKEEMTTDKAGDIAKNATAMAKEDAKDSAKVNKDANKDAKQLDKESKRLQNQMKKDEQNIIKMTKESQKAAKKQEELMARYEELTAENDAIYQEEEQKKAAQPAQKPQQNENQQAGGLLATNAMKVTNTSQSSSTDNAEKMEANNQQLTLIGAEFKIAGNTINRNRKKIVKLQKSTKANQKRVDKKLKIKDKKIKEAEKKEQDKQKRLAKQLAAVGLAENTFTLTKTTGQVFLYVVAPPLLASVFTHAAGVAWASAGKTLITIGDVGLLACAVAKAGINIANGNLTGALMGLGQAALAVTGAGAAAGGSANSVLTAVSAGLQVVSSSAEMVNNVRTLQGKEANGFLSKISTIAGVAATATTAAASFVNGVQVAKDASGNFVSKSVKSAFSQAGTFGKIAQIGAAAGTALSSTNQIMSEFNLGDEKTRNILGTVGGAISMAAAVGQLISKKSQADSENQSKSDDVKKNTDGKTKQDNSNTSQSTTSQTPKDDTPQSTTSTTSENDTSAKQEDSKDSDKAKNESKPAQEEQQSGQVVAVSSSETSATDNTDENLSRQDRAQEQSEQETRDVQMEQLDVQNESQTGEVKENAEQETKTKNKFGKVIDLVGQGANVAGTLISLFATDEKTDEKKTKGVAPSGAQYTRSARFRKIASSNDSYFGGGHTDDQKRRFKKFAKRI